MEIGSEFVYYGSSDEEIINEDDLERDLQPSGSRSDRHKLADSDEPKPKPKSQQTSLSIPKLECAAEGDMVLEHNPFLVRSEASATSLHNGAATVSNLETTSSFHSTLTPFGVAIDENYPELRSNLSFDAIFPFLIKHGLLAMEQREELMLPTLTPTAKADKVLLWMRKVPGGYEKFIRALRQSAEGTDHGRLADMLEQSMMRFSTTLVQPEGGDCSSLKLCDQHRLPSDVEPDSRGIHTRRADTNVISLQFSRLQEQVNVHTGDPIVCTNGDCMAILSHLSTLTRERKSKVWVCEFCGTKNKVDIMAEEIPSGEDTTFALTPVATQSEAASAAPSAVSGSAAVLVFCMDVSGSMAVTMEVSGNFELKRHKTLRKISTDMQIDLNTQFTPRQKKNVTYVSRLECIQAAVERQILQLTKENPEQRVALVTFADEVTVIGDGTREEVVITGSRLDDSNGLASIAESLPMPQGIRHSVTFLRQKLQKIEEGGQTALGPALLTSIILASKVPGSKVIICTDGLANIGVGGLCDLKTDQKIAATQKFYEDLGTLAVDKGVTVSLITIKGTDCRVLELGKVANATMGEVILVDPTAILKEFNHILANPVIATNVNCRIILHRQLYLRVNGSKKSVHSVKMGNVKADSEVSYEFGRKKVDKKLQKECPALIIEDIPHLPFQLQVDYTTPSGSTMKRVFTKANKMTTERGVAEKGIHMEVVGSHSIRSAASLASEGRFTEARVSAHSSAGLMVRCSEGSIVNETSLGRVSDVLLPLQRSIADAQNTAEASITDKGLDLQPEAKSRNKTSETVAQMQRQFIDDDFASQLYSSKQSSVHSISGFDSPSEEFTPHLPTLEECERQPQASPHTTVRRNTDSQVRRTVGQSTSVQDPQLRGRRSKSV